MDKQAIIRIHLQLVDSSRTQWLTRVLKAEKRSFHVTDFCEPAEFILRQKADRSGFELLQAMPEEKMLPESSDNGREENTVYEMDLSPGRFRLLGFLPDEQTVSSLLQEVRNRIEAGGTENPIPPRTEEREETMKQKPSLAHHISSERGIYSVYSPAGGCGKTTFALAYAQELVRRNPEKKVLYWSLQGAEDWPLYFQSSSRYNLSDLLYSLLSDEPIQTDEVLKDTVQRQENGVYLIRPCNQARDLCNLEESELERLLSLLSSVFDVILCDLHSSFDELNERIILRSTRRFYLVNDLSTVRYKWNDFMEQMARSPIRENCLDQAVLVCICEKKNEGKSLTRGFPGEVCFFPWSNRLWKEQNGVLKIRQDSSYYECIRKMA